MEKAITITIGMILLLSVFISAEVISISPEVLEPFSIYSGESITRNITIKTDGDYLVYLDYEVFNNTYNMDGFNIDLPESVFVEREKIIPITLSADYNFKPDTFTIHFTASTEKVEEEITVNFVENETIIFGDLELEINGTGTITIKTFDSNPESGFGIPSLSKFFEITSSIQANNSIIKVSYSQIEVDALGIDENTLRLYFFNTTNDSWQSIESSVDITNNVITGTTNHFSLWGIFGSLVPVIEDDDDDESSSSKGICWRGWTTTRWGECVDNQQTRELNKDWKTCYQIKQEEPSESQSCEVPEDSEPLIESEDKKSYLGLILFATVIVVIIIIFVYLISRSNKWENE